MTYTIYNLLKINTLIYIILLIFYFVLQISYNTKSRSQKNIFFFDTNAVNLWHKIVYSFV